MAAKITIDDAISMVDPEILKILKTDYREILNKRITILDLSYEALKVNVYRNTALHLEAYDNAYNALVLVLNEKATRQYKSIDDLPDGYFLQKNAPFVYINGDNTNRFLIAASEGPIRSFVTNSISKDPRLIKTSFGQNTIYKAKTKKNKQGIEVETGDYTKTSRSKVDIGHISTADQENLISPLEAKISDLLQLGIRTGNTALQKEAQKSLDALHSIQIDASYSFKNTAPDVIDRTRGKLGSMYVVVTLHRQKLNAKFSKDELDIFNKLRATIATKLAKMPIHLLSGSNNIVEDIVQQLSSKISKKKTTTNSHATKTRKTTKKFVPETQVVNTGLSIPKPQQAVVPEAPQLGLTNLKQLLDLQITKQIETNMGTGLRKDVLNLRTGRFAQSVKIDHLSLSKQGLITAFYTYMRNPYGTFSKGGRQEHPTTRDPKLLISKSIHEIASTLVSNRLRAVLA